MGVILSFIAFILSYYTCMLYVRTAGTDVDYTDTMRTAMGPAGYKFGMACFIINLMVPVILFMQLMAQALYPVILTFIDLSTGNETDTVDTDVNWSSFSYSWTCVIILVLEFAMTLRRDLDIYIKLNTIGVFGIIILLIYVFITGMVAISKTDFTSSESVYNEYLIDRETQPDLPFMAYIQLFASHNARLMGILGGGFYLHNISLPIIARNPNPKTNGRDLFIGYFLVFVTYVTFGIVGYLGFSGEAYRAPGGDPDKDRWVDGAIQQNCLFMYPITGTWKAIPATIVRFCVFLHITTVNALLFACERAQILLLFTGNQETESYTIQIILNACLIIPAFLLAVYYPQIGNLAGILGGFATMFVIYIVPNVTYMVMKAKATFGGSPSAKVDRFKYEAMRAEEDRDKSPDSPTNERSSLNDVGDKDNSVVEEDDFDKRVPPSTNGMFVFLVIFSIFVTSYGILAFVFQLTG